MYSRIVGALNAPHEYLQRNRFIDATPPISQKHTFAAHKPCTRIEHEQCARMYEKETHSERQKETEKQNWSITIFFSTALRLCFRKTELLGIDSSVRCYVTNHWIGFIERQYGPSSASNATHTHANRWGMASRHIPHNVCMGCGG